MTPDEHAAEAERLIDKVKSFNIKYPEDRAQANTLLSLAQVHATLAIRTAPTVRVVVSEPEPDPGALDCSERPDPYYDHGITRE